MKKLTIPSTVECFCNGMDYQDGYKRWLLQIKLISKWKVSIGFFNKYQRNVSYATVEVNGDSTLTPDEVWERAKEQMINHLWLHPPSDRK